MRIAHISDIHHAEAHFLPPVAEHVVETLSKLEPELLIVTGDSSGGQELLVEKRRSKR